MQKKTKIMQAENKRRKDKKVRQEKIDLKGGRMKKGRERRYIKRREKIKKRQRGIGKMREERKSNGKRKRG